MGPSSCLGEDAEANQGAAEGQGDDFSHDLAGDRPETAEGQSNEV
jgi:hypothetical protein